MCVLERERERGCIACLQQDVLEPQDSSRHFHQEPQFHLTLPSHEVLHGLLAEIPC